MRQKLLLVYSNLALLSLLLVSLEIGGQIAYYGLKGYWVFESDQYLLSDSGQPFELHPYLAARPRATTRIAQGTSVLTTTSDSTRWTGADSTGTQAVRVAVLGGSTTFGTGVTDTDSWPARLQTLLGPGYAVTNYGVPGYTTAEAVIQMALIVPESRPHIVVLYEGWNDIHNYHEPDLGVDYYRHGIRQYSNLNVQRPLPRGLTAKLAEVSAVAHLARAIARRMPVVEAIDRRDSKPAYPTPDAVGNPAPDPFVDRMYVRNLRTLKALARQMGASVVLVPQVLDHSQYNGIGGNWWTPHVQNAAMPYLIDRFNGFMNTVCGPVETDCVVLDDVPRWQWRRDHFFDEGHFSPQGNAAFARLIAAHIVEQRLRPGHEISSASGATAY